MIVTQILIAYCTSSSGDSVNLLSRTICNTMVVIVTDVFTNLARGWWVSIQSIHIFYYHGYHQGWLSHATINFIAENFHLLNVFCISCYSFHLGKQINILELCSSLLKDYDEPESSLDPFGLGLKDHGDAHIWKCGQCSQTFSQRVLLQMHVCPQVNLFGT